MSIGDGNLCSLDNPLAASTNHWVRQHAAAPGTTSSQVACTESRTHFMEPRASDSSDPKSNVASPNNPLSRTTNAEHELPAAVSLQPSSTSSLLAQAREQRLRAELLVNAREPPAAAPTRAPQGNNDPGSWSPAQLAAWAAQLGAPVAVHSGSSC